MPGGTIPIVSTLQSQLRIPTVMMGFALPDDRMHAPDEKFSIDNFFRGIASSVRFLVRIGASDRMIPACFARARLMQQQGSIQKART